MDIADNIATIIGLSIISATVITYKWIYEHYRLEAKEAELKRRYRDEKPTKKSTVTEKEIEKFENNIRISSSKEKNSETIEEKFGKKVFESIEETEVSQSPGAKS